MVTRRNFITSTAFTKVLSRDIFQISTNSESSRAADWELPHLDLKNSGHISNPGPTELPEIQWSFNESIDGPPLVVDDLIYITDFDETLYALDRKGGEISWEYNFDSINTYISHYNNSIYLPTNEYLDKINATSGEREWRQSDLDLRAAKVKIKEGRIYTGTVNFIVAMSVDTGEPLWKKVDFDRSFGPPAYSDGTLFFPSMNESATSFRIRAVDAGTGTQIWRTSEFEGGFGTRSVHRVGPAVRTNTVLFSSDAGSVHAFHRDDGSSKWIFNIDETIRNSVTVDEKFAYVGGDEKFYAIDLVSGNSVWEFPTSSAVTSSACISNNTCYFGTIEGNLYAIDISNGNELWKIQYPSSLTHIPVLAGEGFYVSGGNLNKYTFSNLSPSPIPTSESPSPIPTSESPSPIPSSTPLEREETETTGTDGILSPATRDILIIISSIVSITGITLYTIYKLFKNDKNND